MSAKREFFNDLEDDEIVDKKSRSGDETDESNSDTDKLERMAEAYKTILEVCN